MNILDFDSYMYRCVVFKLTNHCNLACDYCYRGSNKVIEEDIMPLQTVENVIKSLIEINIKRGTRWLPIYLLWHGGEPLLAGMEYFEKIMEIESKYQNLHGLKILNGIQTNATAINYKWAKFLKDNNIGVGVSIDGNKEAHDVHRRSKTGVSSFESTLRGVKILKDSGNDASAIAVINNETSHLVDDIYDLFGEAGFSTVDFIPCYDYGKEMTLVHEKYIGFMKRVIDRYLKTPQPPFTIRLINDIVLMLNGKVKKTTPVSCELAGRCGEIFSVLTNGDVYPCECLNCLDDMKIGNINNISFNDMVDGVEYKKFITMAKKISPKCTDCNVLGVCKGGCFNRRIVQKDLPEPIDHYCEARKEIINHVIRTISGGKDE